MSDPQLHLLLARITELTAELAEQDRTLPICSAVQDDECLSVRGKWPSHACGFREGHDGSHRCESCSYEWDGATMSECRFPDQGTWCATHKSTRGHAVDRCDRGKWIDCERRNDRLTEALAERDRRIEKALARLQWAGCKVRGCSNPSCAAVHEVQAILRGESDE